MRLDALFLAIWLPTICIAQPELEDVYELEYYKTEPNLKSPKITFLNRTHNTNLLQEGYIFIDTTLRGAQLGVLVYDNSGTLVLNGKPLVSPYAMRTQNTHVCDFLGKELSALCITEVGQAGPGPDRLRAVNHIYDSNYRSVGLPGGYSEIEGWSYPNPHEFKDVNRGFSFVQVVYDQKEIDLSLIGGHERALVSDACFQEVDVQTGMEIFRWCALERKEFNCSISNHATIQKARDSSVEDGKIWDPLHINSVDKNNEGDYLISIRYLDSVIKIAGPSAQKVHGVLPGTVMWRAGGLISDFAFADHENDQWNLQHDARFISTGTEETLFSIHDNHGYPDGPVAPPNDAGITVPEYHWSGEQVCKAKIVSVNNSTMEGKVKNSYTFPEPLRCKAQGSVRLLPNGNVFAGWGKRPFFSEFSKDGKVLLHAKFTKSDINEVYNYRVLKFPWKATPYWSPKLFAYSKTCNSDNLACYVSWNGATEVASWRFFAGTTAKGPWFPLGKFKKTGFETKASIDFSHLSRRFIPYVSVEALNAVGEVIGVIRNRTWVPGQWLLDKCNEEECVEQFNFAYDAENDRSQECRASLLPSIVVLMLLLLSLECTTYCFQWLWERTCARSSGIVRWR